MTILLLSFVIAAFTYSPVQIRIRISRDFEEASRETISRNARTGCHNALLIPIVEREKLPVCASNVGKLPVFLSRDCEL